MATNCTNIAPAPALRGASVWVTLSGDEAASIFPLLEAGQPCEIVSSSKIGYIDFVDTYGHRFRMKPAQPDKACDSDTPGILKEDELITITT